MNMKLAKFLDTGELAARWKKSPRTLENWRGQGIGPNFLKIGGKVLYDFRKVVEFEENSYKANNIERQE